MKPGRNRDNKKVPSEPINLHKSFISANKIGTYKVWETRPENLEEDGLYVNYNQDTDSIEIYTIDSNTVGDSIWVSVYRTITVSIPIQDVLDKIKTSCKLSALKKINFILEQEKVRVDEELSRYGSQSKLLIYEKDILQDIADELLPLVNGIN